MSCIYFWAQVETSAGWVKVSPGLTTFALAEIELKKYPGKNTRVLQTSCQDEPRKRCCGK